MYRRILVLSCTVLLPLTALAQSSETYQCTMGNLQRRVEVVHMTAAPAPCEVLYFKDTEAPGERQVLWSAGNEAGYCESQAEGFIERLTGLGWTCGAAVRAATPPAEPVADDTEALSAPPAQ
jgi:hypothetical protein